MDTAQITEGAVRSALQAVGHAESLADNPLIELASVRSRLLTEGLPDTADGREWALSAILSEIVGSSLDECRLLHQLKRPTGSPGDDALIQVGLDFSPGDQDMEAWSCLYYRYLAPHRLQVNEIASAARPGSAHGRKHISRRTKHGYQLLAARLRSLELEASAADAVEAGLPLVDADVPNNLPIRRSSLFGREDDIAQIGDLLAERPLITLTGPGGVGKTRLAIRTAERQLASFPGGVWLVDLASVTDPGLVLQTVAAAAEIPEGQERDLRDRVQRELADGPVMLVLDNCEHLISECADVADWLLKACPGVTVLATSRERLGVESEWERRVAPLDFPPADLETADTLLDYAACELFVDRARAANPDLEMTGEAAVRMTEVVRRLDGIPLAIELAAARARQMSVDEILRRLDDQLRLLTGGRRTDRASHQALRATIDWSYELLSGPERTVFARLAVFRGGWTLEAAEAVCAGSEAEPIDVLDEVTQLTGKSLVDVVVEEPVARYGMLSPIREYALERLGDGEDCWATRLRHLEWFADLAEEASTELHGPDQEQWLKRLASEHDNFSAALDTGAARAAGTTDAMRLARALAGYWLLSGHLREGRARLERLLSAHECQEHTAVRADLLNGAGALAFNQGDYQASKSLHEESLLIRKELDDERGIAETLRHLGNIADETGQYESALEHYESALTIWQSLGDAWSEAAVLNNMGLVALRLGQYETARARLGRSLELFRREDALWAVGVTVGNLADIAFDLAETDDAAAMYSESLDIAERLNDLDGIAYARTGLANVARRQGRFDAASDHLEVSRGALEELGDKQGLAEWLEAASKLAIAQSRAIRAARLVGAAEALRREIDAPLSPKDKPAYDRLLDEIESALGPEAIEVARAEATARGWQAATADALDRGPDALATGQTTGPG
jgi:non-specific serine/threonine protein kinase